MGAFFLCRQDQPAAVGAVTVVFTKKGFGAPVQSTLGNWRLCHYGKQLLGRPASVEDHEGNQVFAVGTPIYRGLEPRETLMEALEDFRHARLDFRRLRGNFALVFWVRGRLSLVTDALGVCHVFHDAGQTRFSTSFEALIASFVTPKRLNRIAVLEKLTTGYVVGPETIVEGVSKLVPGLDSTGAADGVRVMVSQAAKPEAGAVSRDFRSCVEQQVEALRRYFQDIGPLAREYGVDQGLSSGYDSRLTALLARDLGGEFSVHTHWTQGVHDLERDRVEQLAQALGVRLRVEVTRPLEALPTDALEEALLDGLYFYDGRAADNSGAYSATYTRRYKALTLGPHRLRLNGEGGEIYRNYYHTSRARLDFGAWMRDRLYYGPTSLALAATGLEHEMTNHILAKLSERLGEDLTRPVPLVLTRAYYGEVRLPDCEGVLANADQQLAHFLMPFAEPDLQRGAYALTRQVGVSGRFQAAMIARIDPAIAAHPSHHGFPLSRETLGHRTKAAIRGYVPDGFWLRRRAWRFARPKFGEASAIGYRAVRERSRLVREAEEALRAFVPGFDPLMAVREHPAKATAVYLGLFLREFSSHLAVG